MDNMKHRRLQELDRSDFEITKGEPDIRGWDVRNAAGQKIGEVEDLIVDAQQKKVRYMVVELDDDEVEVEDDKKVLIPIGLAELDKEEDDVLLPTLTVEKLKGLPAYDRDNLDDEAERRIFDTLGGTTGSTIAQSAMSTPGSTRTSSEDVQHDTQTRHSTQADQPGGQPGDMHRQNRHSATDENKQQPELGTAEYYGNFYQHAFFSDESLYRRRMRESEQKNSEQQQFPNDDRGLRLWELRSQGGIIPGDSNTGSGQDREISEERRKEMIRDRRKAYEDNRSREKSSIIQRIKDEGMQDAR